MPPKVTVKEKTIPGRNSCTRFVINVVISEFEVRRKCLFGGHVSAPGLGSGDIFLKAYVCGVLYTKVEEELGLSAPGASDQRSSAVSYQEC